jgi:hypothetical protein
MRSKAEGRRKGDGICVEWRSEVGGSGPSGGAGEAPCAAPKGSGAVCWITRRSNQGDVWRRTDRRRDMMRGMDRG